MKSKVIKKMFAVLLAVSMMTGVAACGNNDSGSGSSSPAGGSQGGSSESAQATPEPTEAPEEDLGAYTIRKDANGNTVDLGGIEIIVNNHSASSEEEGPASAYEEARNEYLDWAQKTYNFTLKQEADSTWASTAEDFANYVTGGGDDHYYINVLNSGGELMAAMKNQLLYDVSTLDCFDLTEDKWVKAVSENCSMNNAVYGFRTDKDGMLGGRGIYFNKRILQESGINPDDLYKWQDAGEWTWEKFEELCSKVEKDDDGDGIMDRKAMACQNSIWFEVVVYTNGGSFVGQDANGKYINNLESAETMEALNWAWDMWEKYDAHTTYPENAEWNHFESMFPNGQVCFYPAQLWRAGALTGSMDDEIGFICFPKGPKATDYVNPVTDACYAIPGCYDAEKAWKIAFAWDVWTEPIPGYEDFVTWRAEALKSFDDTESVDSTVEKLMQCGVPTLTSLVGINVSEDVIWKLNKDNTPAQAAEAVRNSWQSILDTANQ